VRIIAAVREGVCFARKNERVRFLPLVMAFITRRFAPRPISPVPRVDEAAMSDEVRSETMRQGAKRRAKGC